MTSLWRRPRAQFCSTRSKFSRSKKFKSPDEGTATDLDDLEDVKREEIDSMARQSPPRWRIRVPGAFAHTSFCFLWGGQLIALIGSAIFPMAIVAILAERDNMAQALGVVFGARFVGMCLLIILTGVLADRFNKIAMLLSSDVIRCTAVVLLFLVGTDAPAALVTVTFVMGAGESVFQPVYDSTIPSIVPQKDIDRRMPSNMLNSVVQMVGRPWGPCSLPVSVSVPPFCSTSPPSSPRQPASWHFGAWPTRTTQSRTPRRQDLGPHRRHRRLQNHSSYPLAPGAPGVAVLHVLVAVGPWFVILPVVSTERYDALSLYGTVLSVFAVGGLLGATVAGAIGRKLRAPGAWALVGLALFGLACLSLAFPFPVVVIFALSLVAGAGTQFFDVIKTTAMQRGVPKKYLGRVFALDFFASFVMMPAGQMMAGFLIADTGRIPFIATFGGVFVVVTSLVPIVLHSVRSLDRYPQPSQEGEPSALEVP